MGFRGSRMHVLDWVDGAGGSFAASMNELLKPTGAIVFDSSERMPKGWHDDEEARLGKNCRDLVKDPLNRELRDWWLAKPGGANVPNWDLACKALFPDGRWGLALLEAKAHEGEFLDGANGGSGKNEQNQQRIAQAIGEARLALDALVSGVGISKDKWFQVSNRVAFAWKLASEGIPIVLVYLGFVGDEGISNVGAPLRDHEHWLNTVTRQDVLPHNIWERKLDVSGTPLWLLVRSRPCIRSSHLGS